MDRPTDAALPLLHRRIPTAAVVIAVAAQVAMVLAGETFTDPRPGAATLGVDVAAGIATAVLVRPMLRGSALPSFLMAALSAISPAATPGAAVATLHSARTHAWREALPIATIAVTGHLVRGLWRPVGGLPYVWWAIVVLAVAAALVAWGSLGRAGDAVLRSLHERARRAEEDRDRLVERARAEERTRLAWEMHDVLAHRLTIVATHAGALAYRPDAPPARLAEAADLVRRGVQQALHELRDVVRILRDDGSSETAPQPALADLPALADESRAGGTPVELVCDVDLDVDADVPAQIATTTYRIVQEGLTNARKHAAGQPVRVVVERSSGALTIRMTNPTRPPAGRSEVASSGAGVGLVGLRERVELVGGQFRHGAVDGQFELAASIPWSG